MKKIIILKHVRTEGAGTLLDLIKRRGFAYQVIELWRGDALPASLASVGAVVVMGGPMNVYEEEKYSFLKAEDRFIKKIVAAQLPYLGICLGAQLLAKAAGKKVYKAPVEEVGWSRVELTASGKIDPLLAGLPHKLAVFQWHGDTFDLPAGGVLLAAGEQVGNQAFRLGKRAYGFQFHPEVNGKIISRWFYGSDKRQDYVSFLKTLGREYRRTMAMIFERWTAGF